MTWDELASNSVTQANCGPQIVEFYHSTPGDLNDVFEVDTTDSRFKIAYTENITKVAEYGVNYRVHYERYPEVFVATGTTPFTFIISDPCSPPSVLELGEDLSD